MADKERTVSIIIEAKNRANDALKTVGLSFGKLAIAAGAVAAAGAAAAYAITKIAEAASKQEDADVRLAVALASINENTQGAREAMSQLATELERSSKQSDEAIQEAIATLIQLGRIGVDQIPRVTRATVELAAVMRTDVGSAAELMAKAAQGNTAALSRYGIVLDDSIPKNQRFAALLSLIEKNMSGTAAAIGQTLSGSLSGIANDWDNFIQALGTSIVQSETLRDLLGGVSGALQTAETWVKNNKETLDGWVRSILGSVLALSDLGVSTLSVAAALAEIDLKVRSFTGKLTGSSSYGEAMANLDRALIDLATKTAPAFHGAIDEMRRRLEASAPPQRTLNDLLTTSHQSLSDLMVVMHKQGETAVNVAGNIKNFGTSLGGAKTQAQQLDEALKALGERTLAELSLQTEGVDDALAQLEASLESGAISPEQFDAVLESLIAITEQTQGWTTDLTAAAMETSNTLDLMMELQQTAEDAATQGAAQLGDAFVDAAFGARVSWAETIRQILAGIAKAIVRALVLKAIETAFRFGGGGGGAEAGAGVATVVAQHGGDVRGGIPGLDSVAAMLMPGEIVLPRSRVQDFDAIADLAREIRGGPPAGAGSGPERPALLGAFQILPRRDDRDIAEIIEGITRLVERRGYRLVSSEVLA